MSKLDTKKLTQNPFNESFEIYMTLEDEFLVNISKVISDSDKNELIGMAFGGFLSLCTEEADSFIHSKKYSCKEIKSINLLKWCIKSLLQIDEKSNNKFLDKNRDKIILFLNQVENREEMFLHDDIPEDDLNCVHSCDNPRKKIAQ